MKATADRDGGNKSRRSNLRTTQYTLAAVAAAVPLGPLADLPAEQAAQAITEAQFAQAQQDLITRVAQAYFDVLAAQDTLESTRAQKKP
jgi:outer membrane protein